MPDTFWCGTARGAEILCIICRAGQALKREREAFLAVASCHPLIVQLSVVTRKASV